MRITKLDKKIFKALEDDEKPDFISKFMGTIFTIGIGMLVLEQFSKNL